MFLKTLGQENANKNRDQKKKEKKKKKKQKNGKTALFLPPNPAGTPLERCASQNSAYHTDSHRNLSFLGMCCCVFYYYVFLAFLIHTRFLKSSPWIASQISYFGSRYKKFPGARQHKTCLVDSQDRIVGGWGATGQSVSVSCSCRACVRGQAARVRERGVTPPVLEGFRAK